MREPRGTTWEFGSTYPAASKTKPDPSELRISSRRRNLPKKASKGSSEAGTFTTSWALMLTTAGRDRSTAATTAVRRAGLCGPARAAIPTVAASAQARKHRYTDLPGGTDLAFRLELGLDPRRLVGEIGKGLQIMQVFLLVENALLDVPLHHPAVELTNRQIMMLVGHFALL